MHPSHDLSKLLNDWPFDPTTVTSRFVETPEGARHVQLRLDLGILQMQLEGRPDGTQPHGHDSMLAFYRRKLITERRSGYRLDSDACAELQQESVQYYYRYLALLVLKDYDGVIRDTRHNLEIFDLVDRYAASEDLAWEFLQFKPYVCMMNTRAKAEKLAHEGRVDEAVDAVHAGIAGIKAFLEEQGDEPDEDICPELGLLEELITDLRERTTDENPVVRLQEKLRYAIHVENFEEAARLRDQIQAMAEEFPAEEAQAAPCF